MVINESMRKDSTVTFSTPCVLTEDAYLGPYFIKKFTPLNIAMQYIHNNPEEWREPSKFIPERFD